MSRYVRERQKAGIRNETQQKWKTQEDYLAEFEKRLRAQRPLANLQAVKDKAEVKGYKLSVSHAAGGDWEYTIEGLRGQHVRYPMGGAPSWDMVMVMVEMEVDALPG